MDSLRNMSKGGWRPGGAQDGSSSSSGGGGGGLSSFKGMDQVKGWMGKDNGGSSSGSSRGGGSSFKGIDQIKGLMGRGGGGAGGGDIHDQAANHASTPLNQLKDPASFGPPPKRTGTGLSDTGSTHSHVPEAPPKVFEGSRLTATTGGLGAGLSREQIEENARLKAEREEAQRRQVEAETAKPTGPYRADTTGLSTAGLPPPPKFRGTTTNSQGVASPPPPPARAKNAPAPPAARASGGPPSLPPRLPPRHNSGLGISSPAPPPAYVESVPDSDAERGIMNQGALGRLGAAGINVPGFDIGNRTTSPPKPTTSNPLQLSELQSRFSRLNSGSTTSSSSNIAPPPSTAAGGTSWAQKQAALKTASDFHRDPSKVNFNDAKTAASTANNFRERHGEQVAGGWKAAGGLNTKYGISDRFNGNGNSRASSAGGQESGTISSSGVEAKKKPAPPPPVKRVGLGGGGGGGVPPPINFGTKPT